MAKNQWVDQNGNIIVSETNPNRELEFPVYAAVVNMRRVNQQRATYKPYKTGSSDWRMAANRRLSSAAQRAFQKR